MTRTSPPQYAFSAGEVSPLLYGRPDYQRHQTGLRQCLGWLPMRQGGFTRAPGTIWRGNTKGDQAGRLIAFEFAANDAMVLEFTPNLIRFWRYGALVEDSGNPGNPYELASPFDAAAIARLQWEQSADAIYLTDGSQPIQRLTRSALDSWAIADFIPDDGPFLVQNVDTTSTIQASAETGTGITLTASQAIFSADMVGSLIRLRPVSYPAIPLWSANDSGIVVGDLRRYDGNIYKLTAGGNTKTTPPTHLEGIEEVEKNISWEFISDGTGIARITGYTSATSVTADVVRRIPKPCVDAPTYRWAEGAWSDKNGWPTAIAIHNQRLWAAATAANPRTIWASQLGIFSSFEDGVEATDALAYTIAGSTTQNAVLWMASGDLGLYVGALGEVYAPRATDAAQVETPTEFELRKVSAFGVGAARPVLPDGRPIYIARDGQRVFELRYSLTDDKPGPVELSLPSDHLGDPGFVEIAWQFASQRVAWLRRADGSLAVMAYDPVEDVLGWAPLTLAGGFVESICTTPDATSGLDVLTMIVRRTVNGATVRFVEEQPLPYGMLRGSQPITDAVHYFAVSEFTPGTPTDTFSVPHLEGEQVNAWTDQGDFSKITVGAGGTITLGAAVNTAKIGLFDAGHQVELLDVRAAAPDGDTTGRRKRLLPGAGIRLHRTAALNFSVVDREIGEADVVSKPQVVFELPVAAALTTGFSGVAELQADGGFSLETTLRFHPVGGAPATVLMLAPMIQEAGG